MANPTEVIPDEPRVEIKRSIVNNNNGQQQSYGAATPVPTPSAETLPIGSEPANGSVNSTNMDSRRGMSGSLSTIGGNDDAPLIGSRRTFFQTLTGSKTSSSSNSGRRDGLSTFNGVFAPVAMSMFSVLLFLRMGFVIGQSGILVTIGQLCLAYLIVCLTVGSLCAISTNGAIEGGGVYYMISRALGPEFGGSIGVLFFLANVFSCGIYIAGFREVLVNNFGPGGYMIADVIPNGRWWAFLYDFCIALLILSVCLVGAGLFAKTSVLFLCLVGITYLAFLISLIVNNHTIHIPIPYDNPIYDKFDNGTYANGTIFKNYTGIRHKTFMDNLKPEFGPDYTTGTSATFAIVFAVVFSGVTGIMAGANMSGELKEPGRSIPTGTIQAVFFTFGVYFVTTFLLGSSCSRDLLKNNYVVMQNINLAPPLVITGIVCTTFFAGLSNLIGASRVLVRLAEDKLFGALLYPATVTMGASKNPIPAVVISWVLVVCVLLLGALNLIAQIASIFFLLSYAGVNMACLALDLASAPNFRPNFKYFCWQTALAGFVGCIAMMFVVDKMFTAIAIVMLLLILMVLHYAVPSVHWGSISISARISSIFVGKRPLLAFWVVLQ